MKYKTAKVIGHPRSGSHFLAKVLNDNFFHKKDYLKLYAGHSKTHVSQLKYPGTVVFYIHRNNEDTIKSMFILRNRLGLVANTIEEFKSKKLSDMHNKNIISEAICNGKLVTEVDTYLSTINLTIEEYLDEHKEFWRQKAMFIINYDALLKDYNKYMQEIATYIGSKRTEFIRETSRMGWYDKDDIKEILS